MNLKPVSKTRKPKTEIDPIEASLNRVPDIHGKPKSKDTEDAPSRRRGLDPLTEQLGCTSYYHKMIWPTWFYYTVRGANYRLSVTRYYPEKKLALDMGLNSSDQTFIDLKRRLLEAHGIHYFYLTDVDSINAMIQAIEVQ